MADTGIFATTAEIGYKAGSGKSSVSSAEAYTNSYIAQAESFINTACKYNFSDNYVSLNADVKQILKEVASDLAAIYVVAYDTSGYYSLAAAQTLMDVLADRAGAGIRLLQDKSNVDFIVRS